MARVTRKLQVTRLRSFDAATARLEARNRSRRRGARTGRGWTREELYKRAHPR